MFALADPPIQRYSLGHLTIIDVPAAKALKTIAVGRVPYGVVIAE